MKQSIIRRVIVRNGKAVIQLSCKHEQEREELFGSVSALAERLRASLVGRVVECSQCSSEGEQKS